jgi:hypothetical protein
MSIRRYLLVIAIMPIVTACVEGSGGWAGEVRDSVGVRIVTNPVDGLWSAADAWSVVEDLRIGSMDDPDYIFGAIAWVDVGENGDIFVLDRQAQTVRVFSPDGVFLRTIGSPGEGPGELGGSPSVLAVGPGDAVIVADPPRGLHRFDSGGSYVGTVPFEEPAWSSRAVWGVAEGGLLALQVRLWYYYEDPPPDLQEPIVLLGPDLAVVDTLASVPVEPGRLTPGGNGGCMTFYRESVTWGIGRAAILHVASTADYRIRTYEGGALRRIVTKQYEPRLLDAFERDLLGQAQINRLERNPNFTPERLARSSENLCPPEELPPIASVHSGPERTLWVARPPRPSSLLDESSIIPRDWGTVPGADWDVFDGEGRFMGTVEFPDGFRAFAFREGTVYGAWDDETGVPHVLRLRIRRPSAS